MIFFTCNFISCFLTYRCNKSPHQCSGPCLHPGRGGGHASCNQSANQLFLSSGNWSADSMQAATSPPISCSCPLGIDQLIPCKLQPVRQSAVLVLWELISWFHASCNQSANQLFLSSGNWSADSMQAATSPPISCSCPLGIDQLMSFKLQPARLSANFLSCVEYPLASFNQFAIELILSSVNWSTDAMQTATRS
jgi:hypothetical protein